jgi:pheromone a factor receptor
MVRHWSVLANSQYVFADHNSLPPVTKVLLGAMVAIPGSFLCICRQLDLATSRTRDSEKIAQQHKTLFEASVCIIAPLVYMALRMFFSVHKSPDPNLTAISDTIVQAHRFTILKDIGCQASVHNSLPALLLVWLPPLILSLAALLFCGKHFVWPV